MLTTPYASAIIVQLQENKPKNHRKHTINSENRRKSDSSPTNWNDSTIIPPRRRYNSYSEGTGIILDKNASNKLLNPLEILPEEYIDKNVNGMTVDEMLKIKEKVEKDRKDNEEAASYCPTYSVISEGFEDMDKIPDCQTIELSVLTNELMNLIQNDIIVLDKTKGNDFITRVVQHNITINKCENELRTEFIEIREEFEKDVKMENGKHLSFEKLKNIIQTSWNKYKESSDVLHRNQSECTTILLTIFNELTKLNIDSNSSRKKEFYKILCNARFTVKKWDKDFNKLVAEFLTKLDDAYKKEIEILENIQKNESSKTADKLERAKKYDKYIKLTIVISLSIIGFFVLCCGIHLINEKRRAEQKEFLI